MLAFLCVTSTYSSHELASCSFLCLRWSWVLELLNNGIAALKVRYDSADQSRGRDSVSPPQTPHSFSDVRRLATPMPGQLMAHPINGCITKSTARQSASSLGQIWLISVMTTWLIPTGCGTLPGVIQKSFSPWLGVYGLQCLQDILIISNIPAFHPAFLCYYIHQFFL